MTALERFAAVAGRVQPDATLREVRRLTGGVSADVHALTLEDGNGERRTVVVREHGGAGWNGPQSHLVAMEHALLGALHPAGLPVPEPLLLDTSAELLPGPFLVMGFVDGTTEVPAADLDACLEVMAETLARLHTLPVGDLPELPRRINPIPEVFDYLPEGKAWGALREALTLETDSDFPGTPVLLHGDFWPGNLLWQGRRLVAILDWEDAALGDPMCDLAGCRLELLWRYGEEAVGRFTRAYAGRLPMEDRRLALWEIYVAAAGVHFMSGWGLDADREATMRKQGLAFIRQAAGRLGSQRRRDQSRR